MHLLKNPTELNDQWCIRWNSTQKLFRQQPTTGQLTPNQSLCDPLQNLHCSFLQYLSVQFTRPLGAQEHRLQLSPLGKFSPTLYCFPSCSQSVKNDNDLYGFVSSFDIEEVRFKATNNVTSFYVVLSFMYTHCIFKAKC